MKELLEIVIIAIFFTLLAIYEVIRFILVNSMKKIYPDGAKKVYDKNRFVIRWVETINKQQGRIGIGTTLPFLVLVFITAFQWWIVLFIVIDYMEIFAPVLFASNYFIIMTLMTVPYSYKPRTTMGMKDDNHTNVE